MDELIYIGGPLHGQTHTIGDNTVGALDSGHWYERRTLDFAVDDGGAASCDFLVEGSLDEAQAVALARPFVMAIIAAQQAE